MYRRMAVLVVLAGCGSKPSGSRVSVGAFTVPLPAAWTQKQNPDLRAGQVMLSKSPATMILEALPEPLIADPADEATCRAHGDQLGALGFSISRVGVETQAPGTACVVEGSKVLSSGREAWMRDTILRVGDHALSAQCSASDPSFLALCDPVVAGIVLSPGVSSARTGAPPPSPAVQPDAAPAPVAAPVAVEPPKPKPEAKATRKPPPATPARKPPPPPRPPGAGAAFD